MAAGITGPRPGFVGTGCPSTSTDSPVEDFGFIWTERDERCGGFEDRGFEDRGFGDPDVLASGVDEILAAAMAQLDRHRGGTTGTAAARPDHPSRIAGPRVIE